MSHAISQHRFMMARVIDLCPDRRPRLRVFQGGVQTPIASVTRLDGPSGFGRIQMGDLRSVATGPITQTMTGPDRNLETLVRRLHNVVSLAVLVLLGLLAPALGDRWLPTLLLIGGILSIGRSRLSTTWLLLADLVGSVGLWWLFGPVSGAPFMRPHKALCLQRGSSNSARE